MNAELLEQREQALKQQPRPEQPDRVLEVVRDIARDARFAPEDYLQETIVPEGGE